MEIKHCYKCGATKSITSFYRNTHHSDGLGNWCKKCELTYRKQRYHNRKSNQVTITEKRCSKCEHLLPASCFRKNADKTDGLDVHCSTCSRDALRTPTGKKRRMCYTAKRRAKEMNIPFDLAPEDFDMPTHCPILGIELCLTHAPGGPKDDAPSLDRIILSIGYVKGNVIVISQRANRIKNDSSIEELKKVVDFLTQITDSDTILK